MPADVIRNIALKLTPENIANFCAASMTFNKMICKSLHFWYNKLYKDFPNMQQFHNDISDPKFVYKELYNLKQIGIKRVLSKSISEPLI